MHDDMNLSRANARQERAEQAAQQAPGSMADREVPIVQPDTYDAMHRWLDGEATEAEARDSDAGHHVEMWRRIGAEAASRRQAAAPQGLTDRIMAAIPGGQMTMASPAAAAAAPELRLAVAAPAEEASWWQRPLELTPATALLAAGGLLTVGALIGLSLRQ